MAIALSIGVSLLIGISVMYNTQYFWDKESNPNINMMNNTMNEFTNMSGTVGSVSIIVLVVAIALVALFGLSCRGFWEVIKNVEHIYKNKW